MSSKQIQTIYAIWFILENYGKPTSGNLDARFHNIDEFNEYNRVRKEIDKNEEEQELTARYIAGLNKQRV